jgi:hypothetical protein
MVLYRELREPGWNTAPGLMQHNGSRRCNQTRLRRTTQCLDNARINWWGLGIPPGALRQGQAPCFSGESHDLRARDMQRQPSCLAGMPHSSALARLDLTPSSLPALQHASCLCAEGVCSQFGPKGTGGAWARLAASPLPPRFISLEERVDDGFHSLRIRCVPVT